MLCASATLLPLGARAEAQSIRPLSYSRSVLSNGLVLLMNEDHTTPVVAVGVWYHVGAKNEQQGHTGLAHLCEHLMGEGSPNQPLPAKVFMLSIGGTSPHWAQTSEDVTDYYATVPSNELETMLWMESDRMAAPLTRADPAHVASVREVIRQERLESRDGNLDQLARSVTLPWVADAPYQIDPLGPMADLNAATADDAKAFCTPYYVPNNAILSLSGDLSPARTKALVEKYFGGIPRGQEPHQPTVLAADTSTLHRTVLEDPRLRNPVVQRAWPGASFANPDRPALLALASILMRDRVGRLTKALVYDRALATRVIAFNGDFELGGVFQINVYTRPNASLTMIEQVVDSVLADVRDHGVTAAEIEPFARANAIEAVTTLQSRLSRADTLANGEAFAHDPVAYAKQVNQAFALTPADVQRVARKYLGAYGMMMSIIPAGKLDVIAKPELPYTNVTPATPKVTP
jgi:zinc protease